MAEITATLQGHSKDATVTSTSRNTVKPNTGTEGKSLPVIQVAVLERSPTPGAPGEARNTGLDPAPQDRGITEACLVRVKALGEGVESQVQATSRKVRKIVSMALISKKGLGVKKLVTLTQITIEQEHSQQTRRAVMEHKGVRAAQRISLSVLTDRGLTRMTL